jgi:FAD/FMN-containing dehydrogenase
MTMSASLSTAPGATLAHVASLQTLRSQLLGQLITPGSPEYDQAREVLDMTIDAHPLAIVRVAAAQDVAAAIRYASHHDYPVAVRSGGHSLARHSMIDDAIVIDLSGFKNISIDPVTRIARVQAGVTSGDLAGPASELGLALTTGDTSSVGFGGLATGGGIGFMVRKYGLTVDSLLEAQVVTAAGDILTVSDQEHPDLFWAIRGGGGNFGIITEFTLRLAPVPQILGGDLMVPATREAIRGYLEYTATAPDDLSTIGNLMHAPPAPFVPEEWVGKLVLSIIVCWSGSLEDGEQAIAPLRALGTPVADTVRPMPYPSIYLSTEHQAVRHGFALRSMFADELSDEALDTFIEGMQNASSPFSIIHLRGLGGQLARVSNDATAFAHRDKRYMVGIIGVWLDPADDGVAHHEWTNSIWESIRHEGSGVYVNFITSEGEERLRDAYPPETLARLADIKQTYDPENLFRFNQNIRPRS